jgi:hypothetical protein
MGAWNGRGTLGAARRCPVLEPAPNETVEKVQFLDFSKDAILEN